MRKHVREDRSMVSHCSRGLFTEIIDESEMDACPDACVILQSCWFHRDRWSIRFRRYHNSVTSLPPTSRRQRGRVTAL